MSDTKRSAEFSLTLDRLREKLIAGTLDAQERSDLAHILHFNATDSFFLDESRLAGAFNEWMRRYTEEPHRYRVEFQTVREFLAEQFQGKTPSYGASCVAYLNSILREIGTGA